MNINASNLSLFSNSSSSSGTSSLYSMLGEYNNIRSGAFYKAAKTYYAKNANIADTKGSSSSASADRINVTTSKASYNSVKSAAADLQDAATKLAKTDKDSLFQEKEKTVTDEKTGEKTTVREVDTDAIHAAVKNFVTSYNDTLKAADKSGNESIIRNAGYMTNQSKAFSRALEEVGISIKDDGSLSLDEEKLASAKTENIKSLFNGAGSYGSAVAQKAVMVSSAATVAAASSTLYNNTGAYQSQVSGSIDWLL